MPYEFIETALAATFLLIWAFIGVTMLRDQLRDVRRQRLDESGVASATPVRRPKSRRFRRPRPALIAPEGQSA